MTTEEMKIACDAINKFIYFSWNYSLSECIYKNKDGVIKTEILPTFLSVVKWHCNTEHIVDKWKHIIAETNDANAYLPRFYAELDSWNRDLLLNWVMINYNNERPLQRN